MYNRIILDGIQPVVVNLVAGGIGTLIATYYLSKFTFLKRLPALKIPQRNLEPGTLQALYWFLIITSIAFRYSPTLQSMPSIGQFLGPVGYLGVGGLILQWRAGKLPGWQKAMVLLLVLPLEARWRFLESNLFILVIPMVFLVFILRRENSFKLIPVLAVIGAVIVAGYNVSLPMRNHSEAKTITGKAALYGKYAVELTGTHKHATRKFHYNSTLR